MNKGTLNFILCSLFFVSLSLPSLAQKQNKATTTLESLEETSSEDEFSEVVKNTMDAYYEEIKNIRYSQKNKVDIEYDEKEVPTFSDSIYCMRLEKLNEKSPYKIDCNQVNLENIKFFAQSRRGFASVVMGRSKLYFDMFEQKLAKYNLPLELKYLAVIESGLRPQVKSRAGALGLWQFMYKTGKIYGLNQTSYIDERMDPDKATDAACVYLKKLHEIYNDWNLVLAAYNAGPGNVNKAIWRSGGKKSYWEVRPFLPRETQGYVPNFVAMYYLMSYYADHNIKPAEANYHEFELDTLCLDKGIHMRTIDSLIGWEQSSIQELNPIYTTTYIPKSEVSSHCINIPQSLVSKWIAMEDSLYVLDSAMFVHPKTPDLKSPNNSSTESLLVYHRVSKGQNLGLIARKYDTTVKKLMSWNHLRSTNIKVGQRLKIYQKGQAPNENETTLAQIETKKSAVSQNSNEVFYSIRQGESLWAIANKQDTTVETLLQLNPGIKIKDLKVGQKIRIR